MSDAPASPDPSKRRRLQPRDLCRLRSVSDVVIAPDGRSVVYALSWPDLETDSNRAQLYAVNVDGHDNRQLTHGHRDLAATFSADGTRLAFLRIEPEQPARIMVLAWPVGEVTEVARFTDGAVSVRWLDQDRLVVLATTRPAELQGLDDEELDRRPRIVTSLDYRFNGRGFIHDRPQQLFTVSADTGPERLDPRADPVPIGTDGVDHRSMAVSPDGRRLAATAATDDDRDLTGHSHVWLYPVDGSEEPIRLTGPGGSWASLDWHPDGCLVATGTVDNAVIGFDRPHVIGLPEDGPTPRVTGIGRHDLHVAPGSLTGNAMVAVDGGILLPGARRGRIAIDRYHLDSGRREVVHEDDHQVQAFDADFEGRTVVAAITTTTRPAELWRLGPQRQKLISLNDELLDQLDLAETETVTVVSEDGTEVEGFVIRPPASAPEPGPSSPGLVYVHGGPMFQYGLGFFDEFQMAAACGYVVIGGNPRGSDGYGEQWARAIAGDLGNKDWADVLALADHLAALPEVDRERIGIGGGSYGGFMAAWALGHDRRFKAGLVERAVTSWNTMFGTSDIGPWFTERTVGANLESNADAVTRQSPLHYAADIEAPTLILHSEQDWRCPIEQAEQLFAAIRRTGGDAIMVRFPGENHELSRSGTPSHRVERFEIIHEFLAEHLGGDDFSTSHLPPPARNRERPPQHRQC